MTLYFYDNIHKELSTSMHKMVKSEEEDDPQLSIYRKYICLTYITENSPGGVTEPEVHLFDLHHTLDGVAVTS